MDEERRPERSKRRGRGEKTDRREARRPGTDLHVDREQRSHCHVEAQPGQRRPPVQRDVRAYLRVRGRENRWVLTGQSSVKERLDWAASASAEQCCWRYSKGAVGWLARTMYARSIRHIPHAASA